MLDRVLDAYQPWPALVLDAQLDVVVSNVALDQLHTCSVSCAGTLRCPAAPICTHC